MTIESAKKFIEKVNTDEDFKKKLGELKDSQERSDFAKAAGFDFTAEDIDKVKGEQGLSDDELDGVAGGCGGGSLCLEGIGDADISLW